MLSFSIACLGASLSQYLVLSIASVSVPRSYPLVFFSSSLSPYPSCTLAPSLLSPHPSSLLVLLVELYPLIAVVELRRLIFAVSNLKRVPRLISLLMQDNARVKMINIRCSNSCIVVRCSLLAVYSTSPHIFLVRSLFSSLHHPPLSSCSLAPRLSRSPSAPRSPRSIVSSSHCLPLLLVILVSSSLHLPRLLFLLLYLPTFSARPSCPQILFVLLCSSSVLLIWFSCSYVLGPRPLDLTSF